MVGKAGSGCDCVPCSKQVGGSWLRKSTSQRLLHVELGCMPVSFTWVNMACGF